MTEPVKLAVIGATGFLGRRLHDAARARHADAVGTSRRADALPTVDLVAPDIRGLGLARSGHTHAAIAAAVTVIADCDRDPVGARAVNVDGTLELVRQLEDEGIAPILFSSDYVFDGEAGGYSDHAPRSPTTEYGRQKAELEAAVGGSALVLRLGKVYGIERGDGSLLDEMAGSLSAGRVVRAASDQLMTPVLVSDVVASTFALAEGGASGIVNVCGPERRSRLELALGLADALGAAPGLVEEISLDDLREAFVRPKRLDMLATRLLAETDARPLPVSRAIPALAASYAGVRT